MGTYFNLDSWLEVAALSGVAEDVASELQSIPLLLKLGLSLEDAITLRDKARYTIWEFTDHIVAEILQERRNRKCYPQDAQPLIERLTGRGYYQESHMVDGLEIANPWEFTKHSPLLQAATNRA